MLRSDAFSMKDNMALHVISTINTVSNSAEKPSEFEVKKHSGFMDRSLMRLVDDLEMQGPS